jgi:hypothetical protein
MPSLVAATAPANGQDYAVGNALADWGVQVETVGSPTFSLTFQGCLDDANFTNIGSAITSGGLFAFTGTPLIYTRCALGSISGGGSVSATIVGAFSSGAPPAAPSAFALVPGDGSNTITMTAPSGVATIAVHRAIAGTGSYGGQSTFASSTLPYVDSSLVAGTGYDYQFASINASGVQGPWSPPVTTYALLYNTFQTTGNQATVPDNLGNLPTIINGGTWTVGTAGQLTQTATGALTYAILWNSGSIDCVISLQITPPNIASFQGTIRLRQWGNDYVAVNCQRDSSGTPYITIQQLISGSSTESPFWTLPTGLGTAGVLTVTAFGPVVSAYWNGVLLGSVTSCNYPLGTQHGIATYRDTNYGSVTFGPLQATTFYPSLSSFSSIPFRDVKGLYTWPSNPILNYNTVADNVTAQDGIFWGPTTIVNGVAYGFASNTDASSHTYLCQATCTDLVGFATWTQQGVFISGVPTGTTWMKNLLLQPYPLLAPNVPPVFGSVQGVIYFGAEDNTGELYQAGAFTFTDITNPATYQPYSGNPIFTAGSSTTGQWQPSVFTLPSGAWHAQFTGNYGSSTGGNDIYQCSMGTGATPGTATKIFPAIHMGWETATDSSRENSCISRSASTLFQVNGCYETQWTSFGACPYNGFVCQAQGVAISPDGVNWKWWPYQQLCADRNRQGWMWNEVGDAVWNEVNGVAYLTFGGQIGAEAAVANIATIGNGMGWKAYPAALPSYGSPPTALTATVGAGASAGTIMLNGTPASGSPIGYNWDRSPAGFGHWTRIATNNPLSHGDNQCIVNFAYDYRCQAVYAQGASQWSLVLQSITASDPAGDGTCNLLLVGLKSFADVWLTQSAVNGGNVGGLQDYANQVAPTPAQQATLANQPTYNGSTSALVFSGSQYLICARSSPSTPSTGNPDAVGPSSVTLNIVLKPSLLNVLQYMLGCDNQSGVNGQRSGGILAGIGADGNLIVQSGIGDGVVGGISAFPDGVNYTATYAMNTSWKLLTLVWNASTGFNLLVNGSSIYTSAGNKVVWQGNYLVLGGQATTRGANGFHGQIAAVWQDASDTSAQIANHVAFAESLVGTLG